MLTSDDLSREIKLNENGCTGELHIAMINLSIYSMAIGETSIYTFITATENVSSDSSQSLTVVED